MASTAMADVFKQWRLQPSEMRGRPILDVASSATAAMIVLVAPARVAAQFWPWLIQPTGLTAQAPSLHAAIVTGVSSSACLVALSFARHPPATSQCPSHLFFFLLFVSVSVFAVSAQAQTTQRARIKGDPSRHWLAAPRKAANTTCKHNAGTVAATSGKHITGSTLDASSTL